VTAAERMAAALDDWARGLDVTRDHDDALIARSAAHMLRELGAVRDAAEEYLTRGAHGSRCAMRAALVWGADAPCTCGREKLSTALARVRGEESK
jgi:hypothetical protein